MTFFISFLGLGYTTMTGFGALAVGIIRKGGFPRMNMDYVQSILLDENSQMLSLLMIASMANGLAMMMVCWGPIVIHGLLVCCWISNDMTHVTGFYVKAIEMVKKTGLLKKVSDNQSKLWIMRHDIEVYMGVYVTLGIIIGGSSIVQALLYWQIMRMRYLMSPACQQAFQRFDQGAR